MELYKSERQQMAVEQIAARGIQDPMVIEAIKRVPREKFVGASEAPYAYYDTPLPIGKGQTISQPYMVALMAELAKLNRQDRVLEVGTGSGYSAAVTSLLCSHVYSIEQHRELAESAVERLKELDFKNISVTVGDGTLGWSEFAPYNAIIVTAGGPHVPPTLLKQLKVGGRLVMPVGATLESQELLRVTRETEHHFLYENFGSVRFVPLIGEEGWKL
jgi:protein-L-isoaspartate(D-aspartate) O-methyltransferase